MLIINAANIFNCNLDELKEIQIEDRINGNILYCYMLNAESLFKGSIYIYCINGKYFDDQVVFNYRKNEPSKTNLLCFRYKMESKTYITAYSPLVGNPNFARTIISKKEVADQIKSMMSDVRFSTFNVIAKINKGLLISPIRMIAEYKPVYDFKNHKYELGRPSMVDLT